MQGLFESGRWLAKLTQKAPTSTHHEPYAGSQGSIQGSLSMSPAPQSWKRDPQALRITAASQTHAQSAEAAQQACVRPGPSRVKLWSSSTLMRDRKGQGLQGLDMPRAAKTKLLHNTALRSPESCKSCHKGLPRGLLCKVNGLLLIFHRGLGWEGGLAWLAGHYADTCSTISTAWRDGPTGWQFAPKHLTSVPKAWLRHHAHLRHHHCLAIC